MNKGSPVPDNEQKRLEALRNYQILDTAPESEYDHITSLASTICDVPTALITFVDEDRQWMKSKVGLDVCETGRDIAFCAYTILKNEVMVIEDATQDPVFKDNPLVTGEPGIRFHAGAPIRNRDGLGLGSVCAIDYKPRTLTESQLTALSDLADLTMKMLETRRVLDELASVSRELKVLEGLLPICASCKGIRTEQGEWQKIELYVKENSEASFTHGICPDCREKLYPGI
jgi:GAF domain-containing protein